MSIVSPGARKQVKQIVSQWLWMTHDSYKINKRNTYKCTYLSYKNIRYRFRLGNPVTRPLSRRTFDGFFFCGLYSVWLTTTKYDLSMSKLKTRAQASRFEILIECHRSICCAAVHSTHTHTHQMFNVARIGHDFLIRHTTRAPFHEMHMPFGSNRLNWREWMNACAPAIVCFQHGNDKMNWTRTRVLRTNVASIGKQNTRFY